MSKRTKGWLTAAVVLILSGCALFAGVMAVAGMDLEKLSTVSFEDRTHTIDAPYNRVELSSDTADITFVLSDNDETTVVCHEQSNVTHNVTIQDGALVIAAVDTREFYEHIVAFAFDTPTVTISLPRTFAGELSVSGGTGDVTISSGFTLAAAEVAVSTGDIVCDATSAEVMTLNVSTGNVTLKNVTCQHLYSSGTTGDVTLTNVTASNALFLHRSTGNITFDGVDAPTIRAAASTGNITGRLLSGKTFSATTSTGDVDIPLNSDGGNCELSTSTGNISITVSPDS